MSNDVIKIKTTKGTTSATLMDTASRLKGELMTDALERMFGDEKTEKPIASGNPRVLLGLANYGRSPGWDRAKVLQRQMFAAAGSGLEMKFAFYGEDDKQGVRHCRVTSDWHNNPDDMAAVMGRAECSCGCYVNIRSVLQQAVKENQDRPMRAVVIVGDAFHDAEDGLAEAALAANQLRREGTRVFLIQQGDNPHTARRLQYLARVSGATFFRFDPKTQQNQFAEMLQAVSTYAAGGEEALKASGGQAATLLLEHLKQLPMQILEEEREPVQVSRKERR
jgi:hypothetical protein